LKRGKTSILSKNLESRRKKTNFILLVFLSCISILLAFPREKIKLNPNQDLNIILITLDTTRADRIGCYGYEKGETPNLDSLARRGVKFENVYSQVPLTLPSHCSLLTGTYPIYHRVRNNGFYHLDSNHQTLAEILKEKGFKTAAFIASFILDSRFGLDQGFDEYDDQFSPDETLKNFRSERRAEEVFRSFSAWLDRNAKEKFFSWIHFFDPHTPYDPPSPFKEKFIHNPYDGEISYMDFYVGKIVEKLEEKHLLGRSLMILVGDHGEAFGEKGELEHGLFLYDVTLKVPLIMYSPSLLPEGLVIEKRVRLIDLMPTILDFLKIKKKTASQGESLFPFITLKKKEDLPTYIETFSPKENFGWSELVGIVEGQWKYIHAPRPELYNLKNDPEENKNVFGEEEKISFSMKNRLEKIIDQYSSKTKEPLRRLSREEQERLRSLGYLGGEPSTLPLKGKLPDPKDKIEEYRLYYLAKRLEAEGNFSDAAKIYEKLILENPEVAWNYVYLALAYEKMKRMEEAIKTLERGLEKIPSSLIILSRLMFFELRAGKIEETRETCGKILEINPYEFDALFIRGTIHWQMREWEEALPYFEKAMEVEPENKVLQFRYGNCLSALGENKEALNIFLNLKAKYPDEGSIYHELGLVYDSLGKLDEAGGNFRRAVELSPSPITYFDYAVFLEKTGELKKAIEYLRLYLETTREGETLRKKRAKKALQEWEARLKKQ